MCFAGQIKSIGSLFMSDGNMFGLQQNHRQRMMNHQFYDISREWRDENHLIKKMSEEFSLGEFASVKVQRMPESEFKVLKRMTETQQHVKKLNNNPEQCPLNRNSTIRTFQPTRVKLGNQEDHKLIENYINANYVTVEGKKLIATQGPMASTFGNFWRMVEENQVAAIFMLCLKVEKGSLKCDPYWLYQNSKCGEQKLYEIKIIDESCQDCITTRKIHWTNKKLQKSGIVIQYQLHGWTDGDQPNAKIQMDLMDLVNKNIECLSNDKMTVVHCSAGVGRTGTFIAMSQLLMRIREKRRISIFETVRRLREQRWGMVFTQIQYQYLYSFVDSQIKALAIFEKNNNPETQGYPYKKSISEITDDT